MARTQENKKMTRVKKVYIVYHGWYFSEKVAEFKTLKKAIAFIESQEWPDEYCFEVEKR